MLKCEISPSDLLLNVLLSVFAAVEFQINEIISIIDE